MKPNMKGRKSVDECDTFEKDESVRSPKPDCETDEPNERAAKAVEGQGVSGYVLLIALIVVAIVAIAATTHKGEILRGGIAILFFGAIVGIYTLLRPQDSVWVERLWEKYVSSKPRRRSGRD